MKRLFIFILPFLIGNCSEPQAKPQPVAPHPTPVVTDSDWCDKAESNLLAVSGTPMAQANGVGHGCEEGQPTKLGKKFAEVCKELQSNGVFINPRCLATITSCKKVDACTGSAAAIFDAVKEDDKLICALNEGK